MVFEDAELQITVQCVYVDWRAETEILYYKLKRRDTSYIMKQADSGNDLLDCIMEVSTTLFDTDNRQKTLLSLTALYTIKFKLRRLFIVNKTISGKNCFIVNDKLNQQNA